LTKPFCDGSHKMNGFNSSERAAVAVESESP
jgi:CDGSH-type Zn-finger protein